MLAVVVAACGTDGRQGSETVSPTGAAGGSPSPTAAPTATRTATPTATGGVGHPLPPEDAGLDYQLGGAYDPPAGVDIVTRDRLDPPADSRYDICYVNGYQAQPGEDDFWLGEHPDLVLRDDDGDPVIDPDWDEMLLDITTAEKRAALGAIVGDWIAQCARDGYEAVEIDNLDTYSRSRRRISPDDAVAFMAILSARAHEVGLAIAQKNAAEIVDRRIEMGTDFVVAEECNVYDECDVYIEAYGSAVLMIEYRRRPFEAGCAAYPDHSIVLRDLNLTTPDRGSYVFAGC
jgi:hypothetical protein